MRTSTAAALVGAAILSTLVFPLVGLRLRKGRASGRSRAVACGDLDGAGVAVTGFEMPMADSEPLWNPTPAFLARTNHARYLRWLKDERGQDFPIEDYDALWRWSVEDLEGFWRSIWDHFGVVADGDPSTVLGSRAMPGTDWFPDTRLNYAEHIFREAPDDRVAIVEAGELRATREITWGELREQHRADRGRPAQPRCGGGRPRRRLHAELQRGDGRLLRDREPGSDLVELLAGLRRAQRRRPLRADRAEGAARRRRLPLRRQGLRQARRRRRARGGDADARAHGRRAVPERGAGGLGRCAP